MLIEVPVAEVIDKITILEIKRNKIEDKNKLKYVNLELKKLYETMNKNNVLMPQKEYEELMEINLELWDIEDFLREKYNKNELDKEYMNKMSMDIVLNDKRFLVKKKINEMTNSIVKEVKSYKGM